MITGTAGTRERWAISLAGFVLRRLVKRVALPLAVLVPFAYFLPKLALFYGLCGLYDVSRNHVIDAGVLRRYFVDNGILTWLLSPLNILMDLLSLPHVNRGVYRLESLPAPHRDEILRVIHVARRENVVAQLEARAKEFPRTMVFFKWYGVNVDTFLAVPAFHESWRYVQTIGVSVFNRKVSTSKHFGFLRATIRVLYNLNDISDRSAYIAVGDTTHYWCDDKLFIFDDTLMHQSFNQTEQTRYCLFVDILRPTPFPRVLAAFVTLVRLLMRSVNHVFYLNWKVLER